MGDADDAQFNGIEVSLQVFPAIQYLMCFFHVMQKCWEHGRQMKWSEWDAVTEDIYFLHMSSSRDMLDVRMRNVHIKWGQGSLPPLLNNDQVAIGSRFWKWQIFHSAQETALTNNPNEQYSATIKSVLKRRKLHIPHLLQTFATLLRKESERNTTIALAPKVNERLRRHYAMLMKQGRLRLRSAGPALLGLWNVKHLARAHDADDDDEEEYFRRDLRVFVDIGSAVVFAFTSSL
ncbi:hypothetical protein H257_08664 [Aphanomyces astaci]|uniref:MULE transposase domain-containing protein n=1 Tax=Aphanomyces astaci TaxID=112090 RepID=W4GEY9_APHAT|nr:hypothetical protein H257_08664 [Aphanomyces astaci]ETV77841.1 hypothetical protein H257_08664 [Aphanomyces astaci]|eukprot:XP_009832951.1 hypothetical protein H257_08664 [Aphanomyces astaci]